MLPLDLHVAPDAAAYRKTTYDHASNLSSLPYDAASVDQTTYSSELVAVALPYYLHIPD
jgi:hypothetical protein